MKWNESLINESLILRSYSYRPTLTDLDTDIVKEKRYRQHLQASS